MFNAKFLSGVALCATMLSTLMVSGCNQTQVSTVVKDIGIYATEAQPVLASLIPVIEAFAALNGSTANPQLAASLQSFQTSADSELSALVSLTASYKANPNNTTWQAIIANVDNLVSQSDAALLQVAAIKDPATQSKVQLILASVDALLHTIDGFIQTTETSTTVTATANARTVKVSAVTKFWSESDKNQVAAAFNVPYKTLYNHEVAMGF
jgi:hypothetical protein